MELIGPCEALALHAGGVFSCSHEKGWQRIRTPFVLPDGTVIDLFFDRAPYETGYGRVSDLGETLRWLTTRSWTGDISDAHEQYVRETSQRFGATLRGDVLETQVRTPEELPFAVFSLTQAVIEAASLHADFRYGEGTRAVDEVAAYLAAHKVNFIPDQKIIGKSTRRWDIDFDTRSQERRGLVNVLSPVSRSSAGNVVNRAVVLWHDVAPSVKGTALVSVIDDRRDVWKNTDFRLLEDVSSVVLWTQPASLLSLVAPSSF